jgi:hypothetical protein
VAKENLYRNFDFKRVTGLSDNAMRPSFNSPLR